MKTEYFIVLISLIGFLVNVLANLYFIKKWNRNISEEVFVALEAYDEKISQELEEEK
jgi:hypothetical protein